MKFKLTVEIDGEEKDRYTQEITVDDLFNTRKEKYGVVAGLVKHAARQLEKDSKR